MNWRSNIQAAVRAVPDDQLTAAIGELERWKAELWLRLHQPDDQPTTNAKPPDQWLTAKQIADRYSISIKWVYQNANALGAKQFGRSRRFPERGVRRYLAGRK